MNGDDNLPEVGGRFKGTVHQITEKGVVFQFGEGLRGMMDRSYLCWLNRRARVKKSLKRGDKLIVLVKGVDRSTKSGKPYIRLGHPYTEEQPWEVARQRHPQGSREKCKVIEFFPRGAFVDFRTGFRAWLYNEELSWNDREAKASLVLQKDSTIEVVVTGHDLEKRRIHVSYRRVLDHPCIAFLGNFPIGSVVSGKVSAVRKTGWFVRLADGCSGFLHTSHLPPRAGMLVQGQVVQVRVVGFDPDKQRLQLEWPECEEFAEGRELLRLHMLKERNPKAIRRKKEQVLAAFGKLQCESCGFDFESVYGSLGRGFAECHHRVPLAELAEGHRTKLSELAIVCANCHRMLHRSRPMLSVEQLKAGIQSRREFGR